MVATQIRGKKTNSTRRGHITPATKVRENLHSTIVGILIYYDRAVAPVNMLALGSITANQAKRNETKSQAVNQLLD